jgi:Subtilase family
MLLENIMEIRTNKQVLADIVHRIGKYLFTSIITAMLLPSLALAQIPSLKITNYQVVSSKRINATQFEYEYRVTVTNAGADAEKVIGSVSVLPTNTQIIDGGVSFDTVLSGQIVTSMDTIKIRQDRRFVLSTKNLHWHFRFVTPPVQLDGTPTDLVTVSARDFYNGDGVSVLELSDHPVYGTVARTKLTIIFQETATTKQVNDVLEFLRGGITSMLTGSTLFGIRIPDPGSVTALDNLVALAKLKPGVDDVFPATTIKPSLLPDTPGIGSDPGKLSQLDVIGHHLAAKAHSLWNARKSFNDRFWTQPTLHIFDYFGDGPPNLATWGFKVPIVSDFGTGNLDPDGHGYFVASVIGAKFGKRGTSLSAKITGILPGPVELSALDMRESELDTQLVSSDIVAVVVEYLKISGNLHHVVNMSYGFCNEKAYCDAKVQLEYEKISKQFIKAISGANLDKRVVFTVSAGNYRSIRANERGPIQRAFIGPLDLPTIPLTNGLVVQNFINKAPNDPKSAIGCKSPRDSLGGTIGGFGENIHGYINRIGDVVSELSGTSFSAPQLAGVAHFVWTMADPRVTAPEVVDRIIASGYKKEGCADINDNGLVVDAYAAALTADREIKFGRAPVRETILDVNEDNKFDDKDIQLFLKAFAEAEADVLVADYSRFDLNGDGYTGGDAPTYTGRFKLSEPFPAAYTRPNLLNYGTVSQTIEGVSINFDENKLTDLEILAYYAYSPLYNSNPASDYERTLLFLPYTDKLRLKLDRVAITWKPIFATPTGWTIFPTIQLFEIAAPQVFFDGNNGFFELGTPFFSSQIPAVVFYGVGDTLGIPYFTSQFAPNCANASSFVASDKQGKLWINATGRVVRTTDSNNNREYQSRFYLGDPGVTRRSTQTVTVGSVPGSNKFGNSTSSTGDNFAVSFSFIAAP